MPNPLEIFISSSLSGARRIAWFGLAADPPTLAHRAVVDAVLGSGLVDAVVVFPAAGLDYKEFQASDWQRMEMSELWYKESEFDSQEVILSRFDLLRDKAFLWYELWQKITALAPRLEHYLVLGSDQYLEIPRSWEKGKELLKKAKFIVVPRKGYNLREVLNKDHLLKIPAIPGSSTEIRTGDWSQLDDSIRSYILENNLYK